MKSFTYDPTKITENGKDRLRFELGDTMVEGAEETCALTDEEYEAVLSMYPTRLRKAKLALLASIMHRFMYEVDTKVGPLSLSLHERAKMWKAMYDELKAEDAMMAVPSAHPQAISPDHYFYEGMHDNREPDAGGRRKGHVLP